MRWQRRFILWLVFGAGRGSVQATGSDGLAWILAVPSGVATVSGELSDRVPVQSRQVRVEASPVLQIGVEP